MPPEQAIQPSHLLIFAHLERQTRHWHKLNQQHWLGVRLLGNGYDPINLRYRTDPVSLERAAEEIAHWNAKGRNAYSVRNPIKDTSGGAAKDTDILAAFECFADCDDPEAAEQLLNFVGPKYTYAVVTGTVPYDRPHPYWDLTEPVTDLAAWTATQKAIAARLGSDSVVTNPSRIMRIAGTVTWPDENKQQRGYVSELVTIRTAYPDDRAAVPFDQLQRAFEGTKAPQPQTAAHSAFSIDIGHHAIDREQAVSEALSGQEWHNNIIRLVASYVNKGLSDSEIHAITDPMTLAGYTVEDTRREVQMAIDGARAKGWAPQYADTSQLRSNSDPTPNFDAPPPVPPSLEWFDNIEASLADSYVVKNVLGDGAMSVVYGPSNSGKTFFTLDLAYHIAIDAKWRNNRVRGGGVLYLAAEGGKGLINRVVALKKQHGVCDVPLAVKRAGLDLLRSEADLQSIVSMAAEVGKRAPLRLIVVDTLSRVMAGGDENSAQDMTAFIRNVGAIQEATGAHICIVHHSGKDAAKGARGHSSLRAATDTEIEVQNEDGNRAAYVAKQRDYSGGETFAFALKSVSLGVDPDGDEVTSCIIEETDSAEFLTTQKRTKGLGGNQKILAEAFDILASGGDGYPNPAGEGYPERGKFMCVDYARFRTFAMGKIASENPDKAFYQAFRALSADRGLFCKVEETVWRTDKPIKSLFSRT